jgi:hypothetical protein
MAVIALTDAEMSTLREIGATVPRALRGEFLRRFAELLEGRVDPGPGDAHRAARLAAAAVLHGPHPALAGRGAVNAAEMKFSK